MVDLIVLKKNRKEQKFDPKKIIYACKAAGASEKVAKQVSTEITRELSFIPSSKIRTMALEKLDSLDPKTANSWREFDKTKPKKQ